MKAVCSAACVEVPYRVHASARTENSTVEPTTKSKSEHSSNTTRLEHKLSRFFMTFHIFVTLNIPINNSFLPKYLDYTAEGHCQFQGIGNLGNLQGLWTVCPSTQTSLSRLLLVAYSCYGPLAILIRVMLLLNV